MAARAVRLGALVVAGALVLPACGGSSGDGASTTEPTANSTLATTDSSIESEPAESSATTPEVPEQSTDLPPLLEGGVVSEAALAAVLTPDGLADPVILEAFAAELSELPIEQQEVVVADLSLRTELALAALSGLEAAVGDRAATEAALIGASSQVQSQIAAGAAEAFPPAVSGFASPPAAPSPSSGAVAGVGMFLGYMALATFGKVVTENTNTIKPGEDAYNEGNGMTIGANLEEVDLEIKFKGKEHDVDVEFVASTTIHPCPAADGTFTVEALIDIKASKGGAGQNAKMELKIDGSVDDNAEIASQNVENHTQWADYGGGKGQFVDFTYSGENGVENVKTNRTGGTLTDDFVKTAAFMSSMMGLMIASQLIDATEKSWKSGRCVELKVTPSAGPDGLSPSEVVNVLAEPRSKIDGSKTGGTVTALLTSGAMSVDPSSTPLPADAEFTYTAPDELDQKGTVSFESRSKRGVGKAAITFSTSKPAAYQVVGGLQDWQVNQVVCDVMKPFTLESPGIGTAEFSGGLSGTYSATGIFDMHYEGTYQVTLQDGPGTPGTMIATSGGTVAGQAGSGSENYVLTPATC